MSNPATARGKAESFLPENVLVPSMLVLNTLALFALNSVGEIPNWIKTAAALFLAF